MENVLSPAASDVAKRFDGQKLANDAKVLAGDMKEGAHFVADRSREAASDTAGRAKDLFEDAKSSGRELVDEYAQVIKRRRRQLSDVSTRVGEYADDNTALVAGGALVLGILLGVAFSKRSA
jgi:hypothetical protein